MILWKCKQIRKVVQHFVVRSILCRGLKKWFWCGGSAVYTGTAGLLRGTTAIRDRERESGG
jgi:hypothetical protein